MVHFTERDVKSLVKYFTNIYNISRIVVSYVYFSLGGEKISEKRYVIDLFSEVVVVLVKYTCIIFLHQTYKLTYLDVEGNGDLETYWEKKERPSY